MNAQRVISDLRELAARTSTAEGAQRLAWGPVWRWVAASVRATGRIDPNVTARVRRDMPVLEHRKRI